MNRKYKILLIILILACSYLHSYGQEQFNLRERADKLYVAYQYAAVVPLYLKLIDVKKPKQQDVERLADCYFKMNNYADAEKWYALAIQYPENKSENLIFYASVLKSTSKYAEAKKALQQYAEMTGDLKSVYNEIQGCDSAQLWISKPTNHKIKNEELVNTPLSEFGVYIAGDKFFYTGEQREKILKKVYGRTGNSYLRIYTAQKDYDSLLKGRQLDKAVYNDGPYHVGPLVSNKANNTLYVTRTYEGKNGQVLKENKIKFRNKNLELYIYTSVQGTWDAMAFPYNNVEKYSVGHAALSNDEKILYFVSDMPGGLGGTDVWYSELQRDGGWGKPQNAGAAVNTAGDEMFPNISANDELYYSSNGLPGMGGLDIYRAKGNTNHWSKPLNLRFPINSAGDDFSLIKAQTTDQVLTGFLSSNREGGRGGDDIYRFNTIVPKWILALKGTTINKKTNQLLPATTVTLCSDGKVIRGTQLIGTDGTFFFELDKNTDYTVKGQKLKFVGDSATLTTKGLIHSDTLMVTLRLDPLLVVGDLIVLENIHYDFDKDDIRPDAARILNELVSIMQNHPSLKIELGSHTDSRGVDSYNIDLSQRRAKSAVHYLINKGISRTRMVAIGYGETQLLNKCSNGVDCGSAEHQVNRRTDFKILEY